MSARRDAARLAKAKSELIDVLTAYGRVTGSAQAYEAALLLAIFDLDHPKFRAAFERLEVKP